MLQDKPIFAYIPASDLARARAFYEEELGFTPGEVNPYAGVTYQFGDGTAAFLYVTPNAGSNKASTAFWGVDDVRAEVAELKAKGITFEAYEGVTDEDDVAVGGGAKAAWFKDSEGNTMALIEDGED